MGCSFKMKQKFILDYLNKQIPPNEWRLHPNTVLNGYNNKEIDKETALYILKTLFYKNEDVWAKIKFRSECLDVIMEISKLEIKKKDKKLRAFLEEIVVVEYWYPIRFKALSLIDKYYPKLTTRLFNYIHEDTSFMEWGLRKWESENLDFLKRIIKDPLVLFYLILKKEIKHFNNYLSISDRKIKINGDNYLILGAHNQLRRKEKLKEYNSQDLLQLESYHFIYKLRKKEGIYYEIDDAKNFPVICPYIENCNDVIMYYGISRELYLALIFAIKEVFSIADFPIIIIKTSIYYLVIRIPEIELYLRYRLGGYTVEKDIREGKTMEEKI